MTVYKKNNKAEPGILHLGTHPKGMMLKNQEEITVPQKERGGSRGEWLRGYRASVVHL